MCVSRPGQDTFSTDPDVIRSRPGPMSRRDAVCLNCTGHSEGDYCDQCVDGYFMVRTVLCCCGSNLDLVFVDATVLLDVWGFNRFS